MPTYYSKSGKRRSPPCPSIYAEVGLNARKGGLFRPGKNKKLYGWKGCRKEKYGVR